MEEQSLLQKLDGAVYRIRVVEKERNETLDRIKQLEREAGELKQLISTAEAKADEILKAS
ncbi:MAG TPA: hypothetical protein VN415_01075 [Dehalococcoidia bacterium]|jgi:hypothetical protein|nr:hypothetical protein [Dehalococcoidia bacterium]